jgi:hypothetical protein
LDASGKRFIQAPTPENRAAYELEFKVFSDWVLRKKMPEDSQANESGELIDGGCWRKPDPLKVREPHRGVPSINPV